MGLIAWWKEYRKSVVDTRRSLEFSSDRELIEEQVPELSGLSDTESMAYVLRKITEWKEQCSEQQAAIFAANLRASNDAWNADGLTMPYWGNLWVLRAYQAELGLEVPAVAPSLEVIP